MDTEKVQIELSQDLVSNSIEELRKITSHMKYMRGVDYSLTILETLKTELDKQLMEHLARQW